MRQYLAEQKKGPSRVSGLQSSKMDKLTQEIDTRVAARFDKIKTPEHVAAMNEAFRRDVLGYEGPDALDRCKEYAKSAGRDSATTRTSSPGECRWAIKTLRQRAGIMMALNPKAAPIAAEIRARTQETLRNPAGHEGARH